LIFSVRACRSRCSSAIRSGTRVTVLFQKRTASGDGALAAAAQLSEALHVANRHARRAQALQERQPREILLVIASLVAAPTRNRIQQPDPLVVAQRVSAEAGPHRRFVDREIAHEDERRR
jgi:hypothetical protein